MPNPTTGTRSRVIGAIRARTTVFLLAALLAGIPALAQDSLSYSPDITLTGSSSLVADDDVLGDAEGANTPVDLGALPPDVDVVAFHEEDGKFFFVVDIATVLPGGVFADGQDIVLYDGNTYTVVFDGSGKGVPAGADLDALVVVDGGDFIFSLDIDTVLDGFFVADEDLVLFDGSYGLVFDGSGAGVPPALDIDAVTLIDGEDFVLSFDTGGEIDAIEFYDQDGLVHLGGASFDLVIKGSTLDPGLVAGDIDALHIGAENVDLGEIFADGFESGDTSAWSQTVP